MTSDRIDLLAVSGLDYLGLISTVLVCRISISHQKLAKSLTSTVFIEEETISLNQIHVHVDKSCLFMGYSVYTE